MGGKGSGSKPGENRGGGRTKRSFADVDKDFNRRVIAFNKELYKFDLVDFEPENVEARFYEYLELCDAYAIKPSVTGVAQSFGMDGRRFWEIAHGVIKSHKGWRVTSETTEEFQKIYTFLESVLENFLANEGRNPAKWIFLAKNHFGYSDTREQIVTHREDGKKLPTAEDVAKRLGLSVDERPALEAEVIDIETTE